MVVEIQCCMNSTRIRSREEDHFSSLNPHQAAEMRDISARYLSISAEINDPILHRGQKAVPGAGGSGDKHSLACVNGLPSWVWGYLHKREGIKAELQSCLWMTSHSCESYWACAFAMMGRLTQRSVKWLSEAMGSDLVLPHHLKLSVMEIRHNPDWHSTLSSHSAARRDKSMQRFQQKRKSQAFSVLWFWGTEPGAAHIRVMWWDRQRAWERDSDS